MGPGPYIADRLIDSFERNMGNSGRFSTTGKYCIGDPLGAFFTAAGSFERSEDEVHIDALPMMEDDGGGVPWFKETVADRYGQVRFGKACPMPLEEHERVAV